MELIAFCFLVTLLVGAVTLVLVWATTNDLRREKRGRKLLERARKIGPVLYCNQVKSTKAVCRMDDFEITTSRSRLGPKLWEQVGFVRVRPTFPFCVGDSPTRTMMHIVVTKEQMEELAEALVLRQTGYARGQVDGKSFKEAIEILIAHNTRLFVPFADKLSDEEGERQLNFYGSTPSFNEIREYLLK